MTSEKITEWKTHWYWITFAEIQLLFIYCAICCTCVCICINAGRGTIGNKFWIMAQPSLHQGQHRPIVLLRQEADDDDNAFACLLFFISKPQLKLILISHLFIGHNLWILWSICLIPVGFAVPRNVPRQP